MRNHHKNTPAPDARAGRTALVRSASARDRRVARLVIASLLLGLLDLALTLDAMSSTGMLEANPIARAIATAYGSPWPLVAFKCVPMAFGLAVLYACRRRTSAELGAWLGFGISASVIIVWMIYAVTLSGADARFLRGVAGNDGTFIRIGGRPIPPPHTGAGAGSLARTTPANLTP